MTAPWEPFLREALRGNHRILALLDLPDLLPVLQAGDDREVQNFLRTLARRLESWLPQGGRVFLLGGPLVGLLSPEPRGEPLEPWLAKLRRGFARAHFRWKNTVLQARGRLVALRPHRITAPETLLDPLLETLLFLPSGTWTWVPVPLPPTEWERFWEPWIQPWAQALQRRRTVLWVTGGAAQDREIVLDLLHRTWVRLGFPLLRAYRCRARHWPYGALVDALERYHALRPAGPVSWQRMLDPQATFTMTQARRWLTEAVEYLSSGQPVLLLLPEFQAWPPESQHVIKHLIRQPGNFSLVITSSQLPDSTLRPRVSVETLPDLRDALTPAAMSGLFPGLEYPAVLNWFLARPSTHRLQCLRVLYALKGYRALEGLSPEDDSAEEVLAALPPEQRRFLRMVSVLEGTLDPEVVQALTGLSRMEVEAHLQRLQVLQLLRSDGFGRFFLPPTPLRRRLRATLKPEHRLELHRRALRVLEPRQDPLSRHRQVGHLLAVGRYGQALHLLLDLAQEHFQQGAPISALRYLRRAARLARFDPSLREILRRDLDLPTWLPHPNSVEALPALVREALSLAEDLRAVEAPLNLFGLNRWTSRLLCHIGRYEEAWNLGQDLYRQAGMLQRTDLAAQALEILGLTAWYRDDLGQAMNLWKQALMRAQESGDPLLLAQILGNLGMVYQRRHQYALALRHYVGALRIYNRQGYRGAVGIGLGMIGNVFRAWGNLGRAFHYYRRAAHASLRSGDTYNAVVWKAEEGFLYADLALWEEGLPCLLEALTLARSAEALYLLATLQVELLWVQARRGYGRQALAGLQRMVRKLSQRGMRDLEMRARAYALELLIGQGELGQARRLLHELEQQQYLPQNPGFRDTVDLLWIRYYNAQGRAEKALRRFSRWFQDLRGPIPSGTARLRLDALRGETLVRARDPRARAYLEDAWNHVEKLAQSLSRSDWKHRFLRRCPEVQTLRTLRERVR